MEINRNNYEAYLLDYFENNLDPGQVAELMVFLEMNPDLKADMEGYEAVILPPEDALVFPGKEMLKKDEIRPYAGITATNCEEYFIFAVEDLLTPDQSADLEIFLGLNPGLQHDFKLYQLTKLVPDAAVTYPDKTSLKKGAFGVSASVKRSWVYGSLAAAAGIAILISIFSDLVLKEPFNERMPAAPMARQQTVKQDKDERSEPVIPATINSSTANPASTSADTTAALPNTLAQSGSAKLFSGSQSKVESGELALMNIRPAVSVGTPNQLDVASISEFRTENIEVFGYIQDREHREYLDYLASRDSKPWYVKAARKVRSVVAGPDVYDPEGIERENKLWMLAEAGIKGVNYLTSSNLTLNRQLDEDGRTISYAVASERIQYSGKAGK